MAVWTELCSVHKKEKSQYSPVQLQQARLVRTGCLLYGTRAKLVHSDFAGFCKQKYMAQEHFCGNGPNGKIGTKHEPIRLLGFTSGLPHHKIIIISIELYLDSLLLPFV